MFDLEGVKRYRLENHITQEELASSINTSSSYVSKIENPNREINPSLKNIIKICGELDICPSLIMNCNCSRCSLRLDPMERLKCKKRTLDKFKIYVDLASELVEYELSNYAELLESELSFGDVAFLRKNNKL